VVRGARPKRSTNSCWTCARPWPRWVNSRAQKIGSADVTKQYTDIESPSSVPLAPWRSGFIAIIKNGKGEVKDLIAAERELGRCGRHQDRGDGGRDSLLQQPGRPQHVDDHRLREGKSAPPPPMVITEHVTMKIEADDVEKVAADRRSLAVTEAKGPRHQQSDLKQHACRAARSGAVVRGGPRPGRRGQGTSSRGSASSRTRITQRLQQAEGGTAPAGEIKSRTDDVRFNVTLYNVANNPSRARAYVLQGPS